MISLENQSSPFNGRYVIGIDEVGRGSLAGPVVVAAVAIPLKFYIRKGEERVTLKDSKKLNFRQREFWFLYLKKHPKILFKVSRVGPKLIDRLNITRAANLAALRAFVRLTTSYHLQAASFKVFLDGGLYLESKDRQPFHHSKATTIVRADESIPAVTIASIIAKGYRDRLIVRMAKQFPGYDFEIHKGYGTKRHRAAIRRHGPCALHRRTFLN